MRYGSLVAFGFSFGRYPSKPASINSRDFRSAAARLRAARSSLVTTTYTPLGFRPSSSSSTSISPSSASSFLFFDAFRFCVAVFDAVSNSFTHAATPCIRCVFFGFAGGAHHFSGALGANIRNKSGDSPLGCVIAIPRNCPGVGRPPIGGGPVPIPVAAPIPNGGPIPNGAPPPIGGAPNGAPPAIGGPIPIAPGPPRGGAPPPNRGGAPIVVPPAPIGACVTAARASGTFGVDTARRASSGGGGARRIARARVRRRRRAESSRARLNPKP